ncbi:dihydrodipicolinate reductase [Ascidiaceihabitans sp.]|uniref:dihydrodipicolinate reductase n=1 Tax=Ascidiaceihabitans sp. TaxID=1872644 RepID=UPI0032992710
MQKFFATIAVAACVSAHTAAADVAKVQDKRQFVDLVAGKTLTRPFVKLEVSKDGTISGRGARWDVTGQWAWRDGYFCRDLFWGGDPLGYNCQEVTVREGRVKFTSDKGNGDSAEFRVK